MILMLNCLAAEICSDRISKTLFRHTYFFEQTLSIKDLQVRDYEPIIMIIIILIIVIIVIIMLFMYRTILQPICCNLRNYHHVIKKKLNVNVVCIFLYLELFYSPFVVV
jgi:hypothetical protein